MNSHIVRRSSLLFAAVSAVTLLAACQDKRVKAMNAGITRDSVMTIAAQQTSATDSMPSIYKRETYLINGKMLEVDYFDSRDRKEGRDTVKLRKLTPLVMYDGKLVGKGWSVWDSAAKANHIKVPE